MKIGCPGRCLPAPWPGLDWLACAAGPVYCALSASDFADGVLLAANHSGDSDSTGALIGNLLSAQRGQTAIPANWLADLEIREEITMIADDLHAVSRGAARDSADPNNVQRGRPMTNVASTGTPVLVGPGHSQFLERIPLVPRGQGAFDEAWLQKLIHDSPECLPFDEIEPGFGRFFPVCREAPVAAGFVDNLLMTGAGEIAIVETKLFRNPEARRQAVAQAKVEFLW